VDPNFEVRFTQGSPHNAAERNERGSTVGLRLKYDVDPSARFIGASSPLKDAISFGRNDIARWLSPFIQKKKICSTLINNYISDKEKEFLNSALHGVAIRGWEDMARKLLDRTSMSFLSLAIWTATISFTQQLDRSVYLPFGYCSIGE
jgi:hypothetical protein